jgi:hypothetical protein
MHTHPLKSPSLLSFLCPDKSLPSFCGPQLVSALAQLISFRVLRTPHFVPPSTASTSWVPLTQLLPFCPLTCPYAVTFSGASLSLSCQRKALTWLLCFCDSPCCPPCPPSAVPTLCPSLICILSPTAAVSGECPHSSHLFSIPDLCDDTTVTSLLQMRYKFYITCKDHYLFLMHLFWLP